ncbi:hypothetical protein [Vallitalea guaymasensis]|uniref:hypothetical protein n=1 Tax=Vallitalea guaymasensis TaxID=1185412 RepID=UPI000DE29D9A|nr:hypothetical protein [Vallitalea guaymasensis]
MAEKTSNYNLIKPSENETADINVINGNFDIIDTKIKENHNHINNAVEDIGDKANLITNNKDNIVNAVNEISTSMADIANYKSDSDTYQIPTIVGTQIQLQRQSDTKRLFFKLNSDLSGGDITISLDSGTTEKILKDIENVNVIELSKGFVEVVEETDFFTYAPKGGGIKIEDAVERLAIVKSDTSIKSGDLVKVLGDTVSPAISMIDKVGQYGLADSSKRCNIIKINENYFLLSDYNTISIVKIDDNGFFTKETTIATSTNSCLCGACISENRAIVSYGREGALITFDLATNTIINHYKFSFDYSYQQMKTSNFVIVDENHVILVGHNDYFDNKTNQYAMLTITSPTSVTVGSYVPVSGNRLGNGANCSTYKQLDETHFLSTATYNYTYSWIFTVIEGSITNMVKVNIEESKYSKPFFKLLDSHTLLVVNIDSTSTVSVYKFNNDYTIATLCGNSVSLTGYPRHVVELKNGNLRMLAEYFKSDRYDIIDYDIVTTEEQVVVKINQRFADNLGDVRLSTSSNVIKVCTDEIYCCCSEPTEYNTHNIKRLKACKNTNGVAMQNGIDGNIIKIQQW